MLARLTRRRPLKIIDHRINTQILIPIGPNELSFLECCERWASILWFGVEIYLSCNGFLCVCVYVCGKAGVCSWQLSRGAKLEGQTPGRPLANGKRRVQTTCGVVAPLQRAFVCVCVCVQHSSSEHCDCAKEAFASDGRGCLSLFRDKVDRLREREKVSLLCQIKN